MSKWKMFYELPEGATFHTGISRGAGIRSNEQHFTVYRKDTKSIAQTIEVHGWGHVRYIGTRDKFAPGAMVFPFEPIGYST